MNSKQKRQHKRKPNSSAEMDQNRGAQKHKKLQHFARLRALNKHYSLATALILVERMLINADLFLYAINQQQQAIVAKEILTQYWAKLLNRKSKLNVDAIQNKLEGLFDIATEDSLAAQSYNDFVVALGICLDAFADQEMQPAVEVAKLSQGDIERYIEAEVQRELTPGEFRAHELVQCELSVLDSMLDFLQSEQPDNFGINEMKMVICGLGVSNLGVSNVDVKTPVQV